MKKEESGTAKRIDGGTCTVCWWAQKSRSRAYFDAERVATARRASAAFQQLAEVTLGQSCWQNMPPRIARFDELGASVPLSTNPASRPTNHLPASVGAVDHVINEHDCLYAAVTKKRISVTQYQLPLDVN